MKPLHAVLLLCLAGIGAGAAQAAQLGVNIFGISYHYKSQTYINNGSTTDYNQINSGIGVQYAVPAGTRNTWFAEAGIFKDSKAMRARYAALGYKWWPVSYLGGGLAIALLDSESYGVPIAPLPVITVRGGRMALNATWIPALDSTESGAIAFYATVGVVGGSN